MNNIDTHFHLDLFDNPKELVEEIEKLKVYTVAVTNTPSVFSFTHEITRDSKYVRAALGLHPELVDQRAGEIDLFKHNLGLTKYIGEVGLDFSGRNLSSKDKQIRIFQTIIQLCADAGNKILTVHSRKAEKEVTEIIGNDFPGKVILHWYSGSLKNMEKALEYGFYFSVNHQMVKSQNGLRILKKLPPERILTESDGPFVVLNGIASTPKIMDRLCRKIDETLEKSPGITQRQVYENFLRVLQLSE